MPFLGSFVDAAEIHFERQDPPAKKEDKPKKGEAEKLESRVGANDVNEDLLPENAQPFPSGGGMNFPSGGGGGAAGGGGGAPASGGM